MLTKRRKKVLLDPLVYFFFLAHCKTQKECFKSSVKCSLKLVI